MPDGGQSIFQVENLAGTNPSDVINAIRSRAEVARFTGSIPRDGRKLGLVIEGGAMRSVHSAGGAVALAQMGLSDVFDEVYATSAGVMNASYFLSNQPMVGITVYYDSCTSPKFMSHTRVWKMLDVDYLFDQVVRIDKPLDTARVLAARPRFLVSVIDRDSGEGKLIDVKNSQSDLLDILKAATAMPVFYNRSVAVDGRRYIDGGLAIPFPLPQAIASGCTDILVLMTRPSGYRSQAPSQANRWLFDLICAHGNSKLNALYANHYKVANASRELALGGVPSPPSVNIATLCAPDTGVVRRTTMDAQVLFEAATDYARRTFDAFGQSSTPCRLPAPARSSRSSSRRGRRAG